MSKSETPEAIVAPATIRIASEDLHKMLDPKPLEPGFRFQFHDKKLEIVREDEEGFLLLILTEPDPVG